MQHTSTPLRSSKLSSRTHKKLTYYYFGLPLLLLLVYLGVFFMLDKSVQANQNDLAVFSVLIGCTIATLLAGGITIKFYRSNPSMLHLINVFLLFFVAATIAWAFFVSNLLRFPLQPSKTFD